MAKVECWFDQDLKEPVKVRSLNGNVFTLDNVGSLIGVRVFSDGSPVSLTGSVTGYCILADDTTVSLVGYRSGNTAYVLLPQSALAIPGFIKIAVKLTNDTEITTLLAVVATVYRSRTDSIITPSQQIITDWAQQINAALTEVTNSAVRYNVAQSLSDAEKAQARANIGASGGGDVPTDVVKYTPQSLTTEQKTQARSNIDAPSSGDIISDPVRYGTVQSLTDAQKIQARSNIGAASADDIVSDPVRYGTVQNLSPEQKTQARNNIWANIDIGLFIGSDGYIYQEYTV